ncbi:MAG TPA: DNA-binding response regulator [Oribacterium sp.]|nr:DNA-binding response regulator [Oribacterium sp.]
MLKIAVVEDQQEVREELCLFVRRYAEENSLQAEVVPIEDGEAVAEHYEPGWDIIFMDVEMPGLDGFRAAEKIRETDAEVVLVFVTNMAQYAIRGYEVDALDYVLKPVNYAQFALKLSRALQRVERRKGGQVTLQLPGGDVQLLYTKEIHYLETSSRMLHYHTVKGIFSVRASLQSAEKQLAGYHFARCNQCYLVNLAHVRGIEDGFVLVGEDRLEVSRRQRAAFMTALASYMGGAL